MNRDVKSLNLDFVSALTVKEGVLNPIKNLEALSLCTDIIDNKSSTDNPPNPLFPATVGINGRWISLSMPFNVKSGTVDDESSTTSKPRADAINERVSTNIFVILIIFPNGLKTERINRLNNSKLK